MGPQLGERSAQGFRSGWQQFFSTLRMHFGQLAEAFSAFRRDHASRFGAALAFYIALSIAPVAVVAIAGAAMIFGRQAAEGVIFHQIAGSLGAAAESAVEEIVRGAARPRI